MYPLRLHDPSTSVRDRRRPSRRRPGRSRPIVAAALVAMLLVAGLPPLIPAGASTCALSGAGTSASPYVVAAPADLQLVGVGHCPLSAHYRQTANISLAAPFTPIGTSSMPFTGTYSGLVGSDPAEIRGLELEQPSSATGPLGLFAATNGASIQNLTIVEPTVLQESNSAAGVLVGSVLDPSNSGATTTIADVTITGAIVTGRQWVGGLVGRADAPLELAGVSVDASIDTNAQTNGPAGGIVGEAQSVTFEDVTFTGQVGIGADLTTGFETSGGLIGVLKGASTLTDVVVGRTSIPFTPAEVRGRISAGGIVGTHIDTGALTIQKGALDFNQVYAQISTTNTDASQARAGGALGATRDGAAISISDLKVSGSVESLGTFAAAGGLIGYAQFPNPAPVAVTAARVDVDATITGSGATGGAVGWITQSGSSTVTVSISSSTFFGTFTETQGSLGGVIGSMTGSDYAVALTDVTAGGALIQSSGRQVGGAIGDAAGDITITRFSLAGAMVPTTITVDGPISSGGYGGVVGEMGEGSLTVVDSTYDVDLRAVGASAGAQGLGGVLGRTTFSHAPVVTLRGVRVTGHLEAGSAVGGLVGIGGRPDGADPTIPTLVITAHEDGATVTRSQVDATIVATFNAGGAVGSSHSGGANISIDRFDVTAGTTITGGGDVGGVAGTLNDGSRLVVDDVTVAALVDASGDLGGGIVAAATDVSITNSTVSGTVRSAFVAGGFVGSVAGDGAALTITGGAFSGTVQVEAGSGSENVPLFAGGLVGWAGVVPSISGTSGTGGSVQVDHQSGNAFGAVYLAGAVARVLAPGATALDTSSMAGMEAVDLDTTLVSAAIRNAGRCIVSDRANLITDTTLVRSRPLSPDPCPEPAGGFTIFDDLDDGDDDDPSSTTTSTAGGADSTGVSLACSASSPAAGSDVTCTVAGAPGDIDILWEVRRNPVVATGVVRTDASGSGELTFRVPDLPAGTTLAVELVAWTSPLLITVAGPVPSGIPAGEGLGAVPPMSGRTAGLLALLLGLTLAVGRSVAPGRGHAHQG